MAPRKKSLSQRRKEADSHAVTIANAFHDAGVSVLVLDAQRKALKSVKTDTGLTAWYHAYARRVGELLAQDASHAQLIRSSLNDIARLAGVAR